MTGRLEIWGVHGIDEVRQGDDLAALIADAEPGLRDGDVVVVTSKVVSKAEGRLVRMDRLDAVAAETVRVVAQRGDTRIVQTRHGLVLAAAGVDASNVPPGHVALLPEDPDASARAIRAGLAARLSVDVGVVVTDTFGRPWRNGLVDVAIGAAGVLVLDDHRGRSDRHGHALEMTVTAVADEVAAAAELVKGKLDDVPVAVVRGLERFVGDDRGGAQQIVRPADEDMFRLGTREAMHAALLLRAGVGSPPGRAVDTPSGATAAVDQAVTAAGAAASPVEERRWRFIVDHGQIVVCLPAEDAGSESELLGVGAAVGNLLLALAIEGVSARWLAADAAARVPDGARAVAVVAID